MKRQLKEKEFENLYVRRFTKALAERKFNNDKKKIIINFSVTGSW